MRAVVREVSPCDLRFTEDCFVAQYELGFHGDGMYSVRGHSVLHIQLLIMLFPFLSMF